MQGIEGIEDEDAEGMKCSTREQQLSTEKHEVRTIVIINNMRCKDKNKFIGAWRAKINE